MLIYTAGKYSGDVEKNIAAAREIAAQLWNAGHAVICPHLNTAGFEDDCAATYEQYIEGDLNIIARVDALVMIPGWEQSKGACIEHEYATSLKMPIYYFPDTPHLHVTETGSPEQCKAFRETVGQMYRVHMDKNADYSPANILATGEIGLVTRLWDKTARLMNLVGIYFDHLVHTGVRPPRRPKNEAIEDSFMDLAVYAIIGLLYRRGKWGK
jgi:hypothetical protein